MPKARQRAATSRPMRPRPMIPSRLPNSSTPANDLRSHVSAFIATSAGARLRARASIRPTASSAVETVLPPGRVHHQHAAPRRRHEVDVVDAHARAADHLEARRRADHLGVHLAAAADQDRVVGRHELDQLGRRQRLLHVDGPTLGAQDLGAALGDAFEDEDPVAHVRPSRSSFRVPGTLPAEQRTGEDARSSGFATDRSRRVIGPLASCNPPLGSWTRSIRSGRLRGVPHNLWKNLWKVPAESAARA